MKTFTEQELTEILRLHGMWLRDEEGGEKANLSNSDLRGSNLSNSNFNNSDLSYSDLRGSNLSNSNFNNSDLRGCNFNNSNFSGCNFNNSNFSNSDLSYSNFNNSDLRNSNFSNSDLRGCNFSNSNFSNSNFSCSNLRGSNLRSCFGQNAWIKTLDTDSWSIAYTYDYLQIGCKNYQIADWWEFDDERIKKMDNKALEWWVRWKPILQSIIQNNPALPTEQKTEEMDGNY